MNPLSSKCACTEDKIWHLFNVFAYHSVATKIKALWTLQINISYDFRSNKFINPKVISTKVRRHRKGIPESSSQ